MPRRDPARPALRSAAPRAARLPADPPHHARPGPALVAGAAVVALALAGCSSAGGDAAEPRALPRVPSSAASEVPAPPPDGGAAHAAAPGAPPRVDGLDGVDADLAARFEAARAAAAAEDVELRITSGRRTAEEQQRLVDEAVAKHGVPEAYRWVLPPETSAHVQGLAIDVGATQGAYWLAEHGLEFGLCQTYANEVWHFEKLPDGADTCPEQHPDSSWGW